jgi:serine/threonine-protein kinase
MSAPQEVPLLKVGAVVAKYRLGRRLGKGGFGVVYEAEHAEDGTRVALKALSVDLTDARSKTAFDRFLNEVAAIQRLRHPNVVQVYDSGIIDEQDKRLVVAYYTMELLEGQTLDQWVRDHGKMEPDLAVKVIRQAAAGVHRAHSEGIIHRDIKPGNIYLAAGDRAVVMDFGICKLRDAASVTSVGQVVGTPRYLAPEQLLGGDIDARTDVFALGAVFYFLLTGGHLRPGNDVAAIFTAVATHQDAARVRSDTTLPAGLRSVLTTALLPEPTLRFPSARAFSEALETARVQLRAETPGTAPPSAGPPRDEPSLAESGRPGSPNTSSVWVDETVQESASAIRSAVQEGTAPAVTAAPRVEEPAKSPLPVRLRRAAAGRDLRCTGCGQTFESPVELAAHREECTEEFDLRAAQEAAAAPRPAPLPLAAPPPPPDPDRSDTSQVVVERSPAGGIQAVDVGGEPKTTEFQPPAPPLEGMPTDPSSAPMVAPPPPPDDVAVDSKTMEYAAPGASSVALGAGEPATRAERGPGLTPEAVEPRPDARSRAPLPTTPMSARPRVTPPPPDAPSRQRSQAMPVTSSPPDAASRQRSQAMPVTSSPPDPSSRQRSQVMPVTVPPPAEGTRRPRSQVMPAGAPPPVIGRSRTQSQPATPPPSTPARPAPLAATTSLPEAAVRPAPSTSSARPPTLGSLPVVGCPACGMRLRPGVTLAQHLEVCPAPRESPRAQAPAGPLAAPVAPTPAPAAPVPAPVAPAPAPVAPASAPVAPEPAPVAPAPAAVVVTPSPPEPSAVLPPRAEERVPPPSSTGDLPPMVVTGTVVVFCSRCGAEFPSEHLRNEHLATCPGRKAPPPASLPGATEPPPGPSPSPGFRPSALAAEYYDDGADPPAQEPVKDLDMEGRSTRGRQWMGRQYSATLDTELGVLYARALRLVPREESVRVSSVLDELGRYSAFAHGLMQADPNLGPTVGLLLGMARQTVQVAAFVQDARAQIARIQPSRVEARLREAQAANVVLDHETMQAMVATLEQARLVERQGQAAVRAVESCVAIAVQMRDHLPSIVQGVSSRPKKESVTALVTLVQQAEAALRGAVAEAGRLAASQ